MTPGVTPSCLAPSIEGVLAEAAVGRGDLTGVVVGVGPGPFTGLRVGLVTARVIGMALTIPVHGVCSLDALAWASGLDGEFLVATDARRREVYWGLYRARPEGPMRVDGPGVCPPGELAVGGRRVVGRGAVLYPEVLGPAHQPLEPAAGVLADVAAAALARGGAGLLPVEPLYLRRPDAAEPGARKRVLG